MVPSTSGLPIYLVAVLHMPLMTASLPGWSGVELRSPVLYETAAREFERSVVGRVDVVSVASPSAVKAIGRLDLPFASIGATTSAALCSLGLEP